MSKLSEVIEFLHPGAKFLRDYETTATGDNAEVTAWALPGKPPTHEEVAATIATTEFIAWKQARDNIPQLELEKKARAEAVLSALKARGPVSKETSIAKLRERIALLEEILGV